LTEGAAPSAFATISRRRRQPRRGVTPRRLPIASGHGRGGETGDGVVSHAVRWRSSRGVVGRRCHQGPPDGVEDATAGAASRDPRLLPAQPVARADAAVGDRAHRRQPRCWRRRQRRSSVRARAPCSTTRRSRAPLARPQRPQRHPSPSIAPDQDKRRFSRTRRCPISF
jgi:hypothetical protein